MKLRLPLLLPITLLALLSACAPAPEESSREISRYSIEQFLESTSYTGASFSPDKSKILVSSDLSGIFNAYALPTSGGEPEPLTDSQTESIFALSYFPADERVLLSSDQGGNELSHVYLRETDGSLRDLTPGEEVKANFLGWSRDDRSFFVGLNERDPRFFDIYEFDVETLERALIYRDETGLMFADISPDRRLLAFTRPNTTSDSDVFLFDRDSGEMTHLTPHEGDVANTPMGFSVDGSELYLVTDEDSEFAYLARVDLESGDRAVLVQPEWDVVSAKLSKGGRYLAVSINADARTDLRVYETAGMEPVELPLFPEAEISSVSFSRDERTIAFYASSSLHPRELYVHEIGSREWRRLTDSLNPEIDPRDLVQAEVVRFESYDGVEIPGILYRPHGASEESRAPALVWVHGGPGGQSRVGYSSLLQYLVNHGYAVYAINNRGSSGYGKTFYKMDDRRHGEADLGDCVASKQMLIERGWVDPERIGIIGGSYGGYMVLAALAFEPEAFAVGVDIFGVANWVRTLESMPPHWEAFRKALYDEMGDPAEDGERLHRISPLFHAGNITKPLLVLQGANDPRVLKIESDEMVEAARANGAHVEYVVFEDEGHGFLKKENRIEGYGRILEFLDEHLWPARDVESAGTQAG